MFKRLLETIVAILVFILAITAGILASIISPITYTLLSISINDLIDYIKNILFEILDYFDDDK